MLSATLLPLITTYFRCHPRKVTLSLLTKQKKESQTSSLEGCTHSWQQSRTLNHSLCTRENHTQILPEHEAWAESLLGTRLLSPNTNSCWSSCGSQNPFLFMTVGLLVQHSYWRWQPTMFFFNTITHLVAHCLLLLYNTLLLNVFVINADYINYKKVWHQVHWSKLNINLKSNGRWQLT